MVEHVRGFERRLQILLWIHPDKPCVGDRETSYLTVEIRRRSRYGRSVTAVLWTLVGGIEAWRQSAAVAKVKLVLDACVALLLDESDRAPGKLIDHRRIARTGSGLRRLHDLRVHALPVPFQIRSREVELQTVDGNREDLDFHSFDLRVAGVLG